MTKFKRGDLIGVPYNNYIYPVIYINQGSQDNPNFLYLNEWVVTHLREGKKLTCSYILRNINNKKNVFHSVKLDPLELDDEAKNLYYEALNIINSKDLWSQTK